MSSITTGNAQQYADSRKLAARARLHQEYTVTEVPWFPWVAGQLPLGPGDSVLDIGCGPGWFWAAAANVVPDRLHLTLADQSAGMIEEAVRRCEALRLASVEGQQADAGRLPFADASFDVVVAMHMLYHVADPAAGIAEMFRVLKPGGTLAVTTNGAGNLREMYALTTVLGSAPVDPSAVTFGYDIAQRLMGLQFGNVGMTEHPASLRVTEAEDVFLALTSYPPGDGASQSQLKALREAIDAAFGRGNGVLEIHKEAGLFLSRKTTGPA
ncbi:MAG TPA: class I SAM-dependent methyltransferase [Devosiaceae bacterium]|jgi:SAM-dependent methyltransferase